MKKCFNNIKNIFTLSHLIQIIKLKSIPTQHKKASFKHKICNAYLYKSTHFNIVTHFITNCFGIKSTPPVTL